MNTSSSYSFSNDVLNKNYFEGIQFEYGISREQSYENAFKCYMKASLQEYKPASFKIGTFYEFGLGRAVNKDVALNWYLDCESTHNPIAMNRVGHILEDKSKSKGTSDQALKYYLLSLEYGYSPSLLDFYNLCKDDNYFSKFLSSKVELITKCKNIAGSEARQIGIMYYYGLGFEKDLKKALIWLKKASEAGDLISDRFLGEIYCRAEFKYKADEAYELLRESSRDGNVSSQHLLSKLLYTSSEESKLNEAEYWCKLSAYMGDPDSINDFGVMFFNTSPKDSGQIAFNLIKNSADLGNIFAQYNLGIFYLVGKFVKKSLVHAVDFFEKSCEFGLDVAFEKIEELKHLDESDVKIEKISLLQSSNNYYLKIVDKKPGISCKADLKDVDKKIFNSKKMAEISNLKLDCKYASTPKEMGDLFFKIGVAYLEINDINESEKWLQHSKFQGNSKAGCMLGWMYYNGDLSKVDNSINIAKDMFKFASLKNDGEGYYGLALIALDQGNTDYAFAYQCKSRKYGYACPEIISINKADLELSSTYAYYKSAIESNGDRKYSDFYICALRHFRPAFDELHQLSLNNDPKACFYMAYLMDKIGSHKGNKQAALDLYNKAVRNGFSPSDNERQIVGKIMNKEDTCPRCGSPLVIKPGRYGGKFKSCSRYPFCNYTTKVSEYIFSTSYSVIDLYNIYCNKLY